MHCDRRSSKQSVGRELSTNYGGSAPHALCHYVLGPFSSRFHFPGRQFSSERLKYNSHAKKDALPRSKETVSGCLESANIRSSSGNSSGFEGGSSAPKRNTAIISRVAFRIEPVGASTFTVWLLRAKVSKEATTLSVIREDVSNTCKRDKADNPRSKMCVQKRCDYSLKIFRTFTSPWTSAKTESHSWLTRKQCCLLNLRCVLVPLYLPHGPRPNDRMQSVWRSAFLVRDSGGQSSCLAITER